MLKPIKYSIGLDELYVFIEERGENSWALKIQNECLAKDGTLEYEPSPSNRSDDFIKRCRFSTPEEALDCFNTHIRPKLKMR